MICLHIPKLLCLKFFCLHMHSLFYLTVKTNIEVCMRKCHYDHSKKREKLMIKDMISFSKSQI